MLCDWNASLRPIVLLFSRVTDNSDLISEKHKIIAGSLEAAYSLNWGAREIWGKGGGETLALL